MIILVIHDDTPGYKETFYKGPFPSQEEAKEKAELFNSKRSPKSGWSAYIIERDYMPDQEEWEKKLYDEYGPAQDA